jgi:DNA (cytosine-5)-methyltransferase 1
MLLLDLFCGAGGAAKGYVDAGFDVIGIDIHYMPRFPYPFARADALATLDFLLDGGYLWTARGRTTLNDFDAIHASPPCQAWSAASNCRPGLKDEYPQLIEPVRDLLVKTGLPYVIENVPGAPLINPVTLCGSQFGLVTTWQGKPAGLRRHRLFESNMPLDDAGPHDHSLRAVPVHGHGAGGSYYRRHPGYTSKGSAQAAREVMRIDWMNRDELHESIPPAYTEYIGKQLITAIKPGWIAA